MLGLIDRKKNTLIELLWVSPILVTVGIIPLLVRLRIVMLTPIERVLYNINQEVSYDFFNKIKSEWLLYSAVLALLLLLIRILRKDINLHFKWFLVPACLYTVLVVVSTYMAKYREPFIRNYTGIINNPEEIASASNLGLTGFIEQYENMYILLSYVILFVATYYLAETDFQKNSILATLLLSATIISVIALLQYYGVSNYESDHWKRIMLGSEYGQLKDQINYQSFGSSSAGTLYNPNYLGVYMSVVLMIAVSCFCRMSGRIRTVLSFIVVLLLFAGLMTSNSSAGFLAAAAAFVGYLVLALVKRYLPIRKTAILVAGFITVAVLLNFTADKAVDEELATLGEEADMFAGTYEGEFEKLIALDRVENGLRITSTLGEMSILARNGALLIKDAEGQSIKYVLKGEEVLISDPVFQGYRIKYTPETGALKWQIGHGILHLHVVPDNIAVIGSGVLSYPVNREVPSIGFERYQEFATYRGFIWSRTFPMMKDNFIIGDGPDTYVAGFPNHDIVGKVNYTLSSADVLSKPHNLYLQIGHQTGVISLVMVLILVVGGLVGLVTSHKGNNIRNVGLFAALIAFGLGSITNDSVVPVTAVVWVLLGMSFDQEKEVQE